MNKKQTSKLISFQNDETVKAKYVSRMESHIAQDELIQGETGSGGKGCLIWCTLNHYSHEQFTQELGLDLWIPKTLDKIFEGMEPSKAQIFSLNILKSIPKGLKKEDTDKIKMKILHFLLVEILPKKSQSKKETAKIISMFEDAIKGVKITSQQWLEARRDADAAAYAADAAADAAAAYAAYAADAAAAAAAYAAYAAYAADAAAAAAAAAYARTSAFERIGNRLIELFNSEAVN